MSLPKLNSYDPQQIQKASEFSSAFRRYWDLLQKKANSFSEELRTERHQAWLESVLAEFYQTASSQEICLHWSKAASQILNRACQSLQKEFPTLNLCLFAYGKLGAEELNLSSDVDLVFICTEEQPQNLLFLRRFQALMEELSAWGFCFRTDFDLRPGGRMGPLVPTSDQFVDYYGNYGEAWERLAFVRLQPIWGDKDLIGTVSQFSQKFSFRKHLDFSLLADLKSLRQRIHSQYQHRTLADQLDLKLGVGGIRDLELFVHALQIVHGGRDTELRHKQTSQALNALTGKKVLSSADGQFLLGHYWLLRRWENLVQAEDDQQTHLLKSDFSLMPPFETLKTSMSRCDQLVSDLLGKVDTGLKTLATELEDQRMWLKELGFSDLALDEVWNEIRETTALSRQKERDENFRLRFLYLFLLELAKFPNSQNRSLFLLRDFLKATRAKATFYSLFLTKENLIPEIARIFSLSPYLANLLCSRPELIDSFIYRSQSSNLNLEPDSLLAALGETKLLSELINGTEFINHLDLGQLIDRTSETADQITFALLKSVQAEMNCEIEILALGKWGGRELGLRSDLDFIFVTSEEPSESQKKAARRFFNRLTGTQQRGGSLYSIDLRLKPTGLVVSSISQLIQFLSTEAAVWERQAYLKSRFLQNRHSREDLIKACRHRALTTENKRELNHIRQELLKKNSHSKEMIDLKYDSGGLVEMEFAVQTAFLFSKLEPCPTSTLDQMQVLGWTELANCYKFVRQIEQIYQAVVISSSAKIDVKSENFAALAEILGQNESQFEVRLRSALNDSEHLLKRLDPRRGPE